MQVSIHKLEKLILCLRFPWGRKIENCRGSMLGILCSINFLQGCGGLCYSDLGQLTCVCVYVQVCKTFVFTEKLVAYMFGENNNNKANKGRC